MISRAIRNIKAFTALRLGLVGLIAYALIGTSENARAADLIAGKQVPADAKLQVGTKLVAYFEKKTYLVEVKEVKPTGKLKIIWVESGDFDEDTSPQELYYIGDATPTRKSKSAALPEIYRALDKNGDGQIGLYEWDRTKYAEFRKLDKNHDGFLTPQELGAKDTKPATAANPTSSTPTATTTPTANKVDQAPTNLVEYNDKAGQSFVFTVTGKHDGGPVWGDEKYSTDSNLAAVAVHSGAVKNGAMGSVTVTLISTADKFAGKAANGVTSLEKNEAGPAFTIKSSSP